MFILVIYTTYTLPEKTVLSVTDVLTEQNFPTHVFSSQITLYHLIVTSSPHDVVYEIEKNVLVDQDVSKLYPRSGVSRDIKIHVKRSIYRVISSFMDEKKNPWPNYVGIEIADLSNFCLVSSKRLARQKFDSSAISIPTKIGHGFS